MKCLIVVPSLIRAGAETQAVALANGLSLRGHAVHLCSFERQLDQRDRLLASIQFHHVPRKSKFDLALVAAISKIIDRENIDVVQGILQYAVLIAWLAARRSKQNPPVVAAIHTTLNRGIKQELQERLLYRRVLKQLSALIFVCENQRRHWLRKHPDLKSLSRVVHNGIDPARFRRSEHLKSAQQLRADLGIPNSAFVITCVAAFRPEKGHQILIEAFSRLPTGAYLLLAGDGSERPGIEFATRTAGMSDRVHFLGTVEDIRPVIVASNVTVLPSTAETFSMAMLESMALEVPMIASRVGGLDEAIVHGESGLLSQVGDREDLGRCMRVLLNDPDMVTRMGIASAKTIRAKFSVDRMVSGNLRVLEAVLRGKHFGGAFEQNQK